MNTKVSFENISPPWENWNMIWFSWSIDLFSVENNVPFPWDIYLGWNENETNLLSNMKLKCCIIIVNFYYSQKSPKGSQTQVHDWIFIQSASFFDILLAITTKYSLVDVTFLDKLNYFFVYEVKTLICHGAVDLHLYLEHKLVLHW